MSYPDDTMNNIKDRGHPVWGTFPALKGRSQNKTISVRAVPHAEAQGFAAGQLIGDPVAVLHLHRERANGLIIEAGGGAGNDQITSLQMERTIREKLPGEVHMLMKGVTESAWQSFSFA